MNKINKNENVDNTDKKLHISDEYKYSSIPKPPEPPKDRILREDGKGLIPPKNYR
jgi:hypothetical protein